MLQSQQLCDECWDLICDIANENADVQDIQATIQEFSNVPSAASPNDDLRNAQINLGECQQRLAINRATYLEKLMTSLEVFSADCQQLNASWHRLINEQLQAFKNSQQKAQLGASFDDKAQQLYNLQQAFEAVLKQNYELRKYGGWMVEMLKNESQNGIGYATEIDRMVTSLERMYRHLIFSSFIVSEQPEIVLIKGHKMELEVYFLAANALDNKEQLDKAEFTVKIIAEETARQLAIEKTTDQEYQHRINDVAVVGSITNSSRRRTGNIIKFNCKVSSLNSRKQAAGGEEKIAAAATKYAFLFQIELALNVGTRFGPIDIWALSNPAMIAVHSSQVSQAHAPITWQLAVGPFDWTKTNIEQQALNIQGMKEVLQLKFAQLTRANRELDDSALSYLIAKMNKNSLAPITYKQFAITPLADGNFSFWTWFYAATELIEGKLLDFWDGGYLVGFIGKDEVTEIIEAAGLAGLKSCLLRFSDSKLGAVSIGFLANMNNHQEALHMQPFNNKDLEHLSLLHRITNCPQLANISHIYPNKSMQEMVNDLKSLEQERQESKKSSQSPQTKPPGGRPYIQAKLQMVAHVEDVLAPIKQVAIDEQRMNVDEGNNWVSGVALHPFNPPLQMAFQDGSNTITVS